MGVPHCSYWHCSGLEPKGRSVKYIKMALGQSINTVSDVLLADISFSIGQQCTNGDVRLIGGMSANEGRVEVCKDRSWGTVCDSGWSNSDARVVCRQLGYDYITG